MILIILILVPVAWHDQKGHVACPFNHLDVTHEVMPLMTLWHHVTLTPASMALHDQKCYVASDFSYLD